MNISSFLLEIVYVLVCAVVLFPVLYGIGGKCSGSSLPIGLDLDGIVKVAIGAGVLAHLTVFSSFVGTLRSFPFTVSFLLVLLLIAGLPIKEAYFWFFKAISSNFSKAQSKTVCFFQIVMIMVSLLTFALCFFPETANDAIAHHLNMAKRFVQQGSIRADLFDFKTFQSLLMNSLYALALFLQGVTLAKLFHWVLSLALVFFLAGWIEEDTKNRNVSLLLAGLFFLTPTLINQMTTTYVDGAASLYTTLAFYLWMKTIQNPELSRLSFLSGLLLGFGLITKLSVILAALSIAPITIAWILWKRSTLFYRWGIYLLLGFLSGSGYFLIRNFLITGDPIFPLLTSLPGEDFQTALYSLGPPKTLNAFLLIPVNITFNPEAYDYHYWVGPFYLLLFPFVVAGVLMKKQLRVPGLFLSFFTFGWFFMGQNARYLLPVFPIYIWTGSFLLSDVLQRKSRVLSMLIKTTATGLFVFLFGLTLYHFRWPALSLIEGWGRAGYLERIERTYPVANKINAMTTADDKILSLAEVRLFYFNPHIVRANMLLKIHPELREQEPEEIVAELKKMGFTYILDSGRVKNSSETDPFARKLTGSNLLEKLFGMESKNIKEDQYRYVFYRLK